MGNLQAMAMAETDTSIEVQISWHLGSNHFPPVPQSMVRPCINAIDAINAGDYEEAIDLPDGISYKGERTAPALEIAEAHHLWAWVKEE